MSVKVHTIGKSYLGQVGGNWLVDISAFFNLGQAVGQNFSLGEESRTFTASSDNSNYATSERFTTNQGAASNVYTIPNLSVAESKQVTIHSASTLDPGNVAYSNYITSTNRAFINNASTVQPAGGNPGQLVIAVAQSSSNTFSTKVDSLIIYGAGLDVYFYALFSGFSKTIILRDPSVNKDYILVNNASNTGQLASTLTNLDRNMEMGFPEETPGGFIFRVVMQTGDTGGRPANNGVLRSSDVAMVLVYKIPSLGVSFTYKTLANVNDAVHPLYASLTAIQQAGNFFVVPWTMTFQQLFQLANMYSVRVAGTTDYWYRIPKNAMFPDQYPIQTTDLDNTQVQNMASSAVNYPFAEYDVLSIDANISNDITTQYAQFDIFAYNQAPIQIVLNGITIDDPNGTFVFAVDANNNVTATTIQLTQPVNMLQVTFYDSLNAKYVTSNAVIRFVARGNVGTNVATYFDNGVFYTERGLGVEPTPPANIKYSWIDATATVGFTDAYGQFTPPGTAVFPVGSVYNLAGPKVETYDVLSTDIINYGSIQGFYSAPTGTAFTSDQIVFEGERIRLNSAPLGNYVFFVLTERGHVRLELNVSSPPGAPISTEYSFSTLSKAPIDLEVFMGGTAPTTFGTVGTYPYIANSLLYADKTVRFQVGNYVFNVVILPTPAFLVAQPPALTQPLKLKVLEGAKYDLSALVRISDQMAGSLFFANSTSATDNANNTNLIGGVYHSKGTFMWSVSGNNIGQIYAGSGSTTIGTAGTGSILVATVDVISLPVGQPSCSTIMARVGEKFNIWDHIEPFSNESVLLGVQDVSNADGSGVSWQTDGTIVINEQTSGSVSFNAEVVILGAHMSVLVTVLIIPSSAISVFLTRDASFTVQPSELVSNKGKLILTTNSNQKVTIRQSALSSQAYNGDDIDISWQAGVGFTLSNLKRSILIAYTDGITTKVISLNPFGTLSSKEIYATLDSSGNATIEGLPVGPEYAIYHVDNTKTPTTAITNGLFYGGKFTFTPGTENDFAIKVPEYNQPTSTTDGSLVIPLRVVQVERQRLCVVDMNTLSGVASLIDNVPSWITLNNVSHVMTVQKTATSSESQSVIIQMQATGFQITGIYKVIEIVFLPKVSLQQTIVYASGNKYADVLPTIGYDYGLLNLQAVVNPSQLTVSASYGELSVVFNMRTYGGPTVHEVINLTFSAPGNEVYATDNSSQLLQLPIYAQTGLLIQQVGSNVVFTKSSPDVNVGEWIVGDSTTGNLTLYTFSNAPPFVHSDVIIYDVTLATSSWTADNANAYYKVNSSDPNAANYPSPFGISQVIKTFAFVGSDKSVSVDAYYAGDIILNAFSIFLESKVVKQINVVDKITASDLITETITAFSLDAISFTAYTGMARIKTTNARLTFSTASSVNTLVVENDKPASTDGERSTVYIKTASSIVILEVFTHAIPYEGTVEIEIYDNFGAFPNVNAIAFPFDKVNIDVNTMVFTPIAPTVASLPSVSTPSAGQWSVSYVYFATAYTGGSTPAYTGSFTLQLSVVKFPATANTFRILPVGKQLTFNAIQDFFSASMASHRLDNVSVNGNPITANFQSTGQVILSSSTPSPANSPYALTLTINVNPSRIASVEGSNGNTKSRNIKVSDVLIAPTLSVFVYDPEAVSHFVLNAHVGSLATFDLTTGTDNIGATLQYVDLNGVQLDASLNAGFDWTNLSSVKLSSNSMQVNTYLFATAEKGVSLVTTVVLPATTSVQTLKRAQLTAEPVSTNLLALCFPTLESQLKDAGLDVNPSTSTNFAGYPLSGYTSPAHAVSIAYVYNGITLSTFSLSLLLVNTPVSPGVLDFTIPMKKLFNLKAEDVNPSYTLSIDPSAQAVANSDTALYATADPLDGINVEFPLPGNYTIGCLLFNANTSQLAINVNFVAYDPNKTVNYNLVSYSGVDRQTLPSSIENYSVDGVNFGKQSTQFVSIDNSVPSAPVVTMRATASDPRHVFIFTLTNPTADVDSVQKNVIIYSFSFVQTSPVDKIVYLIKGESKTLTAQDFTNASTNALIAFNDAGFTVDVNGANFPNEAGTIVGFVKSYQSPPSGGASITLVANEPGSWDNFFVDIIDSDVRENISDSSTLSLSVNPPIVIKVKVITLSSLLLTDLPAFIFPAGIPFEVNLTDYIVNKMEASFTGWHMNGLPVPGNLQSTLSDGVISGVITVPGLYTFTGTITSQHHASLTSAFSVEIVFYDASNTTPLPATLESLQPRTLILSSPVASIDKQPLKDSVPSKNGNMMFTPSGSNLIVQALTSPLGGLVYNVILKDGSNVLLTITQTGSNKDTIIGSSSYSGNVFNTTTGNNVASYVILGQQTTYLPDHSYALPNGGSSVINSDGSFTISSPAPLTFLVSYSGSSTGTIRVIVQGNAPEDVSIEQPSSTIPLPTGVSKVIVNTTALTQANPLTLSYAKFTWTANSLVVSDVSGAFIQTRVQIEAINDNVTVIEYNLKLATGVSSIMTLKVPTGKTASFSIGFTPIAILFEGVTFKGSVIDSLDVIAEQVNIGKFSLNGSVLNVTALNDGFSKVIGFNKADKSVVYYRLRFESTIVTTNVLAGQTLTFPTQIAVVGDSTGQVFPTTGNIPITFNGKLTVRLQSIVILPSALSEAYSFYVTLVDGTYQGYNVEFREIDIFVKDITKFSTLIIAPSLTMTFAEQSVSVLNGNVLNPSKLGQITMLTPFNAKITINIS